MQSYLEARDLNIIITWYIEDNQKYLLIKMCNYDGVQEMSFPQRKLKSLCNSIEEIISEMEKYHG